MPKLEPRHRGANHCDSTPFEEHYHFLGLAVDQARVAADLCQLPVGCVIVDAAGIVLSSEYNRSRLHGDKTAHAEMLAIRAAMSKADGSEAYDWWLYTSLQPCPMCMTAIVLAKIGGVVWAANDPRLTDWDFVGSLPYRHRLGVEVVAEPFEELRIAGDRLYRGGKQVRGDGHPRLV